MRGGWGQPRFYAVRKSAADERRAHGRWMEECLAERAAFLEARHKAAAALREDVRRNPQRCGRRLPGTPGYSCGLQADGAPVIGGPAGAESPEDSTAEAAAYWLCAEHIGELQGACKGRPNEAECAQAWLDDNVMPGISRSGPDSTAILYAAFCQEEEAENNPPGQPAQSAQPAQ